MRYNIVKKTTTPVKAKPYTDKGYTCYTEIELSLNTLEKYWYLEPLKYQINVLYNLVTCTFDKTEKFLNHVQHNVQNTVDEIAVLWGNLSSEQQMLIEQRYNGFGYSKKLFTQAINGKMNEKQVNDDITTSNKETIDQLSLTQLEINSFIEKIKKSRNMVKGAAINYKHFHFTNLFKLLAEYGDEVIVTPTRQPVVNVETPFILPLSDSIENELDYSGSLNNYSLFDRFRIFFSTREIATEFMKKLVVDPLHEGVFDVYDHRLIRHHLYVCNTMVDSINKNKNDKSYNVFISRREKPMKDGAVGYITIHSKIYTLNRDSNNSHSNYTSKENEVLVSEIFDDVMGKVDSINKKSHKFGVPDVIMESNVRSSFSYVGMTQESVQTNSGLFYIVKSPRKYNGCVVTTSKFVSYNDLKSQLTIASQHPIFSSVCVQLHIPIYNNVSPEHYSKILNYARLINMDVSTLMLLPFCMGDENKDALIDIIDELFEK